MEIRSIIKGTAAGITAGTVCYMISRASESKKRSIKKRTVKAARAVSGMLSSITSVFE